jgi:ubiquinone/menaquinone biosynthesis C-methylase UbiE
MDNKVKDILESKYSTFEEDKRLFKDNSNYLEFLTTTIFIDKYLKEGDRILEVGAGTGAYSLHYAKKGYSVDAVELLDVNINVLKSKITDDLNIRAIQGNALDLSMFKDNTFDVTLVLGPMYHLFSDEDRAKAISEAIRVTKPNGVIHFAYISNDSVVVRWLLMKHGFKNQTHLLDKDFQLIDEPEEVFSVINIEKIKNLMSNFKVEFLNLVATDGISQIVDDFVNALDEESFNLWKQYHLSTCQREDLIGYSGHLLYICRKN